MKALEECVTSGLIRKFLKRALSVWYQVSISVCCHGWREKRVNCNSSPLCFTDRPIQIDALKTGIKTARNVHTVRYHQHCTSTCGLRVKTLKRIDKLYIRVVRCSARDAKRRPKRPSGLFQIRSEFLADL